MDVKSFKKNKKKQKEKDKFFYDCVYNKIINKLKKNKVNLIDIVDDFDEKNNPIVDSYLPSKIQILIYTDLDNLIDNMNKRKRKPQKQCVVNLVLSPHMKLIHMLGLQ